VIYVDSSIALAQLLNEPRRVPSSLWDRQLVSSQLLEYEVWNRLNKRHLEDSHAVAARELIGRIYLLEMNTRVLARALRPFPIPIRTLDALHLASVEFVRANGDIVELATFDARLASAGEALGIPLYAHE
jgi:predicted nucleic acid-binding protein